MRLKTSTKSFEYNLFPSVYLSVFAFVWSDLMESYWLNLSDLMSFCMLHILFKIA